MGQVHAQVDEQGVNQLFVKVFNQLGSRSFSEVQSLTHAGVSASVRIDGRAEPVDFGASASPINLLGSAQNPPVRFAGVRVKLPITASATLSVNGWSRSVALSFQAELTLGGGASITLRETTERFSAQLRLQPDSASLSLAGNRQGLVDAARKAFEGIDTNPLLPGLQAPPAALIDAVGQAVGLAFDAARAPAELAASSAATHYLKQVRLDLGHSVERRVRLDVPDVGPLTVMLAQPQLRIEASLVQIRASFS